jgi:hypothetical protein
MWSPEYFRKKAAQCRQLAGLSRNPDIVEQLLKFAREFDEDAGKAERRAALNQARGSSIDYSPGRA